MKARLAVLISILAATTLATSAEITPWEFSVESNALVSFNSYSDTWDGGEAGSFSWAAQLNAELQKQMAAKLNKRTTLKVAFGQTKVQDPETKDWSMPQKSTDLIDIESVFRFTLDTRIDPFIGVRFISQFLDASVPNEDYYINPIELTESFGAIMSIVKKEPTTWNARLGAAVRQTINQIESIDNTNDGGIEFVTELQTANKDGWIKYSSLLKVYEALVTSEDVDALPQDDQNEWRYPDINWENTLTVNLTKYIMLNWYVQMIYDKDGVTNGDLKWKNTVSLGLTYRFTNKKVEE